jgi:hypothetical protein
MNGAGRGNRQRFNINGVPPQILAVMRGHTQDHARNRRFAGLSRGIAQPTEARTSPITTVDTVISLQTFRDRMTSIGEYLLNSEIIHVKKIVDEIAETDNNAPAA